MRAPSPFILGAADVRAAIGLKSDRLDPLIEAGIATVGIDLEVYYNRSLRVGSAPAGSRAYFLSRVVAWTGDQEDIASLLRSETRDRLLVDVKDAGTRADAALAECAKPVAA